MWERHDAHFSYQQLTQTKATAAGTKTGIKGAAARTVCSKLFTTKDLLNEYEVKIGKFHIGIAEHSTNLTSIRNHTRDFKWQICVLIWVGYCKRWVLIGKVLDNHYVVSVLWIISCRIQYLLGMKRKRIGLQFQNRYGIVYVFYREILTYIRR